MSDLPSVKSVFPDTNVLIHGRSVKDLPWGELGVDGVEIVICGPVIREIDSLKNRPGKPGKAARGVSTTVRGLMKAPGMAEVVRAAAPRVTRRLSLGVAVRTAVREGLDLSHGDQAIINQALAAMDDGLDVLLLTDDNFAAMTAAEHGLPVMLMPEHWMRAPEPDDSAKEVARKDAEIARLRAAEPLPTLRFLDENDMPIERLEVRLWRYAGISPATLATLMERVARLAPKAEVKPTKVASDAPRVRVRDLRDITSFRDPTAAFALPTKPVTPADIEKYSAAYDAWLGGVRKQLEGFHAAWNRRREWPRAKLAAANAGTRPAENVLVEIEASGPFMVSGYKTGDGDDDAGKGTKGLAWLTIPDPPAVPKPQPYGISADVLASIMGTGHAPYLPLRGPLLPRDLKREDDAFYYREGRRDPVGVMSLECKAWRHQREEDTFRFRTWASDEANVEGLVTGRISASNLADPVEARLPVRIIFEDRDVTDMAEQLVAEFERRLKSPSGSVLRPNWPDA